MRDYNSRIMRDRTSRRSERMRDRENRRDMRDMRNPYGSRGGYVNSNRRGRDRGYENTYDFNMDYRNDYRNDYQNDYEEDYRNDYRMGRKDMRYDNNMDYADEETKETYHEDLKKWIKKLKKKDIFGMSEDEIINQAKQMGVKFEDFDEEEFIAVYFMLVSDYKQVSNAPQTYLVMAKEWLEDDDIAVSPSEKLCIYMYDIVMGE